MTGLKLQPSTYGHTAPREIYNARLYILACVAAFAAVNYGYDMGFIGTTVELESLRHDLGIDHLSASEQTFIKTNVVSFFQVGCVIGCLASGLLSTVMGRKWLIFGLAVLFNIGSTLQFVATGVTGINLLYFGRSLGGFSVGASSAIVPVYLAEVAPTEIRGSMVGIYEIGVQLGTTIGFWIIYAVKQTIPTSTTQWRFPVAFQLIPGGILMIGMAFLPESPRWVALHQGVEDAHRLLAKIRQLDPSHPYVEWEMQGIVEHNGKVQSNGSKRSMKSYALRYKELALPGIRNRLLTGTILMIFFQMSGTNAINYYSPLIFKSLGFKGASSQFLATGIYGIIRFVCTLVAMLFVVDRVGRRKLIITGSVIMGLCMWYIGAYLSAAKPLANGSRPESAYSAIVFIYVYAAAFCFSYAGIPWIYCSEIFPVSIRTHCTSITAAVHWIFNLLLARAVPYMIANIGASTYFVFGACLTVSVPWAYFFMPETRGLSLEDMETLWTEPSPTLFVRADRRRNMVLQRQNFAAAVQVNEDVEISSKGSHIEKSIENMY